MKRISSFPATSLQHYVLIRHWASDIEFFKIETSFLHRLLDEYFIRLIDSEMIGDLKVYGERLLNLEKAESRADHLIVRQLKEMEWIAKNMIRENKDRIADARVEIEYQMINITLEFRELKKNIFKLVERMIHKDRLLVS